MRAVRPAATHAPTPSDAASADASPVDASTVAAAPPDPYSARARAEAENPVASRYGRADAVETCGEQGCPASDGIYQQLLLAAESEVLMHRPRARSTARPRNWDRRARSALMREVGDDLGLTTREWAALSRNGFAVLRRAPSATPYDAYKEIYRMELPLFVTADSVLHAVFIGHRRVIERMEPALRERTVAALRRMRAALPAMRGELPDEVARDLDLYLSVALALDGDNPPVALDSAVTRDATRVVDAIREGARFDEDVTLFGRPRVMDYGTYAPRGPYAESEARGRWFRLSRWLSSAEFNVVSRDCRSSQPGITPDPRETPREALDAFALAALADHAGALDDLEAVSNVFRAVAGRREDAGLRALHTLRRAAGVSSLRAPDAFERLKLAVGALFLRTARTHPMPQGVARMPVIATTLGVGVTPDAAMTRPIVHDEVDQRFVLGGADVAYAMGHAPARRLLRADFTAHPRLEEGFAHARAVMQTTRDGEDVYSAWLASLMTLATPPEGVTPSFMSTPAWGDLRTNTLAVGYGQLRHGNVVYAAGSYDGNACRIPDAWVEPVPRFFAALREFYTRLGALAQSALPANDYAGVSEWIEETTRHLLTLERIARDELAGHALTDAQRRFLGYVAEVRPSSMGAPTRTGWYVDLFPKVDDASDDASFIADFYASATEATVSYVGSHGVLLGVFVVDRGGAPRLMVGPVSDGYEHHGPLSRRLDDAAAREMPTDALASPWAASYRLDPVPAPRFAFTERDDARELPPDVAARATVEAGAAPGALTVEFLSRHHRVIARGTTVIGPSRAELAVRWLPGARPARTETTATEEGGEVEVETARENDVCAYRLRLGGWVETRRTDEYPYSSDCRAVRLQGLRFGDPDATPQFGGEVD